MEVSGDVWVPLVAYMGVALPVAALISASQMRREAPLPSPASLLAWTCAIVLANFWVAWRTARAVDASLFAVPRLSIWDACAAALALLLLVGAGRWHLAQSTDAALRRSAVVRLAPRTTLGVVLWGLLIPFAAVSEEVLYRWAGMMLLWGLTGNPWLAAVLSAVAFALAHAVQGWRSCAAIFAIGLLLQGLVAVTETLVWAMGVHTAYNYWAGERILHEARRLDA